MNYPAASRETSHRTRLPLTEASFEELDPVEIKISIADNGPGIEPEVLPRLFEPYFTTKEKGSGLGLATSYSIVKRHGGHLTVSSEPGPGSVFNIYLPADPADQPVTVNKPGAIVKGKGRILLMDDEQDVIRVATRLLDKLGYEVEAVLDGSAAVSRYREARDRGRPFDAVIMDLTVPGAMGGKDAVQELKKLDPRVKAIVASGYSEDPVLAGFEDYGFKGMVAKPYTIEELSQVLASIIE